MTVFSELDTFIVLSLGLSFQSIFWAKCLGSKNSSKGIWPKATLERAETFLLDLTSHPHVLCQRIETLVLNSRILPASS